MYLIIDNATNEWVSTAETQDEIADPLPSHLHVVDVGNMDLQTHTWDVTTGTVEPIPVVPDFISPIYTKLQLKNGTKALLEKDPDTWTANEQKRALYVTVLLAANTFLRTGDF